MIQSTMQTGTVHHSKIITEGGDNMTDSEKLNLILSEMQGMKSDMQGMKSEICGMKSDMRGMKSEIQELNRRTTSIELHLENTTDRNIRLIAENFIELTNKLNKAIPAADKNLAYEVKVNYLVEEVNRLKQDVANIRSQTA